VAGAFAHEWGRIVATLIRRTGDWDLAEECAQEAFAQALARWPGDGVPARPGAWLTAYREALALGGSDAERRFLLTRLAEVGGSERPL
jgi:RNA polymerase sigma-70 factor (ECF subfamily)